MTVRLFKHVDHIAIGSTTMKQRVAGIFICLYLGYMMLSYIRKSVSFASPVIMEAEQIGKSQLGLILSSQMTGYTVGKLSGGVLVDVFSPSRVFIIALVLSGVTVMVFTVFDTMSMFAFLWFVNGLALGPSWPACALLIKRWFPAERFGTWWSLLSTSMNVSGTVGPLVSTFLLTHYSWRFSLNAAGSCAVALAGVAVILLGDRPPQEPSHSPNQPSTAESTRSQAASWKEGVKAILMEPVFIGSSLNYLLVSLIRGACTDWGQLYLISEKGHSHLTGSSLISSQELGGVFGSLFTGYVSDYLISKNLTSYSPRQVVVLTCTVIQATSIFLFITTVSSASSYFWITMLGFCTGFGMFGCIAMFGVVAMESTSDRLAGTAHSITALAANIGMVLSGLPLSLVAKHHSWHAVFFLVQAVSLTTIVVAIFCMLSSKSLKTDKLHKS